MEVSIMPSKFLSVVLEEPERKNLVDVNNIKCAKHLSKSVTISHVLSKPSLSNNTKRVNVKCSRIRGNKKFEKLTNGTSYQNEYLDLKKRLPRTVLEECVVELASTSRSDIKMPEPTSGAVIIQPMYTKKLDKSVNNGKHDNVDLRNIFNRVEAVYSDDEDSGSSKNIINDITALDANSLTYACIHCPNKFSNKGALWQHNLAAHSNEKSCECQLCGRKFYRNCSLALHMKCHSDEQHCICKICGKEFNRLSMLERHVRCHSTETLLVSTIFTCKICGKKFNDETTLKMHVIGHNEKFTCEQCNVTFSTKQLLDLHFHITHRRSDTPFACKVCRARFANLRELNVHSVLHTHEKLRISCHHCGIMFTQRCTYKKHLQMHVGERLSCNVCRIDFTQRSSLQRHYKRLHLMNAIPDVPTLLEPPSLKVVRKIVEM